MESHPAVKNGYDVARIRADFPILSREVYGKPLVYLDNAASAQKPRAVLERMREVYERRTAPSDWARPEGLTFDTIDRKTGYRIAARPSVSRSDGVA